jgi:hypothetical protein
MMNDVHGRLLRLLVNFGLVAGCGVAPPPQPASARAHSAPA